MQTGSSGSKDDATLAAVLGAPPAQPQAQPVKAVALTIATPPVAPLTKTPPPAAGVATACSSTSALTPPAAATGGALTASPLPAMAKTAPSGMPAASLPGATVAASLQIPSAASTSQLPLAAASGAATTAQAMGASTSTPPSIAVPLPCGAQTLPAAAAAAAGSQARADDNVVSSLLGQKPPQASAVPGAPSPLQRKDDAVVAGLIYSAPAAPQAAPAQQDDSVVRNILAGPAPGADVSARDDSTLAAVLSVTPGGAGARTGAPFAETRRDDLALANLLRKSREAPHARRDDDIIAAVLGQSATETQQELDVRALAKILQQQGGGLGRQQQLKDDAALASFLGVTDVGEHDDAALAKVIRDAQRCRMGRGVQQTWLTELSNWLCHIAPVEIVAGGRGRGGQLNQLSFPSGVATSPPDDSRGGLLIADSGNRRIVSWQAGDLEGEVLAGPWKSEPFRVISDGAGGLLVSVGHSVEHWSLGAVEGRVVTSGAWPTGITRGKHGAVLIADTLDHCVCVAWLRPGRRSKAQTLAGGATFGRTLELLHRPFDVVLERTGTVLVLDSANHRVVRWVLSVRKNQAQWRPAAIVAGGRGQGCHSGQLNFPRGLAVDAQGAVLVADTFNHRVVRYAPGCSHGEIVAGGRGCGARLDQLNHPSGIAIDRDGSLFIADTGNHRVLRYPQI
mmetsp:Transcript_63808/g.152171  ORF Transcript_63808/g.152171 Transcript_63808/m.152171 type:complete len:679 (-) Transcript_63808:183-2219(-)